MTDDPRVPLGPDDDPLGEPSEDELADAAALAALLDGDPAVPEPDRVLGLVPEREVIGLLAPQEPARPELDPNRHASGGLGPSEGSPKGDTSNSHRMIGHQAGERRSDASITPDRAWARVAAQAGGASARGPRRPTWIRWAVAASVALLVGGGALVASQLGGERGPLPPRPSVALHRAAVGALSRPAPDATARARRLAALQELADAQRRRLIAEMHDG